MLTVQSRPGAAVPWADLRAAAGDHYPIRAAAETRLPLRIFREDIVFRRHRRMARVAAVRFGPLRRKRVRRGIIDEIGVGPSVRVREPLGVFFDDVNRCQFVWYLSLIHI